MFIKDITWVIISSLVIVGVAVRGGGGGSGVAGLGGVGLSVLALLLLLGGSRRPERFFSFVGVSWTALEVDVIGCGGGALCRNALIINFKFENLISRISDQVEQRLFLFFVGCDVPGLASCHGGAYGVGGPTDTSLAGEVLLALSYGGYL